MHSTYIARIRQLCWSAERKNMVREFLKLRLLLTMRTIRKHWTNCCKVKSISQIICGWIVFSVGSVYLCVYFAFTHDIFSPSPPYRVLCVIFSPFLMRRLATLHTQTHYQSLTCARTHSYIYRPRLMCLARFFLLLPYKYIFCSMPSTV